MYYENNQFCNKYEVDWGKKKCYNPILRRSKKYNCYGASRLFNTLEK